MGPIKFLTYESAKGPRAGIVAGEHVFDLADLTGNPADSDMLHVLSAWDATLEVVSAALAKAPEGRGRPLAEVKLLPPVLRPSAIYCAGANYTDHMLEMARVSGGEPEPDPHSVGLKSWHFIKAAGSMTGAGTSVELPSYSKMVDWEAELAVVIGRAAKNVAIDRALDHVAGYTIANDLSARDVMTREVKPASPFRYDWVGQKCFDGACPIGPWIVPASGIPDPQRLAIKLWVNDVLKQDSHTSRMIFSVAEQIVHLSARITLRPGDIILTGTPAGVGMGRKEFLQAGDIVKVWIETIGSLTNSCVRAS